MVGGPLPIDERGDRRQCQPPGLEVGESVAAQNGLGLLVAALPDVRVVGIDRLVASQAHQRAPGQVVERFHPAREAALELPRRVGAPRVAHQPLALDEPVLPGRRPAGQAESLAGERRRGRGRVSGRKVHVCHRSPFNDEERSAGRLCPVPEAPLWALVEDLVAG